MTKLTERTCSKCKVTKPIGEFHAKKKERGGYSKQCKVCRIVDYKRYYQENKEYVDARSKAYVARNAEKVKAWQRNWIKTPEGQAMSMLRKVRQRAKLMGLPFDLELKDIRLPAFCPVLGIALDYGFKEKGCQQSNSPSVDRRIPALGYVKGNIEIISMKANRIKSNATPEELVLIARYFGMMS